MLYRSLAESTGHFWHTAEFENVANPDFRNLKHLQNPGHLPLAAPSRTPFRSRRKFHVHALIPVPIFNWQGQSYPCDLGNFVTFFCFVFPFDKGVSIP